MPNQKTTTEDILQLIKGKPTKNKDGLRTVPHPPNKIELKKFEVALSKNYLHYSSKTRLALLNSFDEYQLASLGFSLKLNTDNYQIEIITNNEQLTSQLGTKLPDLKIINPLFATLDSTKENYKQNMATILQGLN